MRQDNSKHVAGTLRKSRPEIRLNNILKFSSYFTGNIISRDYKQKLVNAVQVINRFYCENHKELTTTLCGQNAQLLNVTL
jgi:hypothetical protein